MNRGRTVADAMLRHPTVHPAELTVGEARASFEASDKTHLLLLVQDGRLVSTLTRDDLAGRAGESDAAARLGACEHRTVAPEAPLARVHELMARQGRRRLAVVDPTHRVLGLLCLKRSLTGFCADAGVAAMRAARRGR